MAGPKSVAPGPGAHRDLYRRDVDSAVSQFGVAHAWPAIYSARARRICYRVIFTECDWWNYANASVALSLTYVPNDGCPKSGGDKNSVGLYQQRAQWWGDTAGSMSPAIATRRFLDRMLIDAPDWFVADEPGTCQHVQRSQFDGVTVNPATGKPYPFAQNYRDRDAQVSALIADQMYFTHES